MNKKILLVAGILAVSSFAFGAYDGSGEVDTGTFALTAEVVENLDVTLIGGLAFGDIVVPDNLAGPNTETIATTADGVTVTFTTADDDETVTVALTSTNTTGTLYSIDLAAVTVQFANSDGAGWTGIPTTAPLYIGGTMSVTSDATGDVTINETVTVTVTYDSIV